MFDSVHASDPSTFPPAPVSVAATQSKCHRQLDEDIVGFS